ncbi:cytochrome P450 [Reticulibacter mediterranei]|nr:cytochrome P450 [Reticulibacter mediterranei]
MQQPRRMVGLQLSEAHPIEETRQQFHWFKQMRAEHPVFYDEKTQYWQVFRYDDVERVITDYNLFSSEKVPGFSEDTFLGDTMVAKDPPAHRKLRNIVNQAFTPRAINQLSDHLTQIMQELLDDALPKGQIDFVPDIAFPFPAKAIALVLGIPDKEWDIFRRWAGTPPGTGPLPRTREEAMQQAHDREQRMYDYFSELLAERRRSPSGDILSALSVAEVDGERLSESDLTKFCLLLLGAGQETTKNLLANAIYCFTQYPDVRDQLIQQPELMSTAVEEILRYLPPVWYIFRRTKAEVELGGERIPANAIVQAWNASANHDPEAFPNPDQLDIRREPNRHLTFGHGIHFCLGAPLARLEARIGLPMILTQLKQLRRIPDTPIMVRAGLVYIIQSLPITFQVRA